MKRVLFLLLSIVHYQLSIAQAPNVKQWDYRYGGFREEFLNGFQETADGGFILGGSTNSGVGGDKTDTLRGGQEDYWVVKLDVNGIKVWDKTFGGTDQDVMNALLQTSDGGYILGGLSRSGIGGDKTQACYGEDDFWIIKIDALGNKQWDRTIGGDSNDVCTAIVRTTDGGYMFGGHSISNIGFDKTQSCRGKVDLWVVKTDSLGNKQWDKTFGGTETERLHNLKQTKDGGYLLAGDSRSAVGGDKTTPLYGSGDCWFVKIDSLGNFQWDQSYGGTQLENNTDVVQTADGGYLFGSESRSNADGNKLTARKGSSDYWIIKADSLGVRQWEKVFGAAQTEEFYSFYPTPDGGYLLLGDSYSTVPGGDKTEPNLGQEQIWVLKMDSVGNQLWDKTMMTGGHDEDGTGAQVKDGCYVFAGSSNAGISGHKTQANWDTTASAFKTYDFWIIKFCDSIQSAVPNANFSSSDTSFCEEGGKCIDFTDLSTGTPTSWKWSFPGAFPDTSTQQNPANICYTTPGSYTVTLIVSNPTGTDTLTASPMITFCSSPAPPVITWHQDTLCSSSGCSYQWYLDGLPVPGETQQCYVPASVCGNYGVYVTDCICGCARLSANSSDPCTGLNEVQGQSMHVYPNPAGSELWVMSYGVWVGPTTLDIMNVLGQNVYRSQLETQNLSAGQTGSKSETLIDISSFSKGIYFIELRTGEKIYRTKFVKD